MAIHVQCPQCDTRSQAPDGAVGRSAQCPRCGATFTIRDEAELYAFAPAAPVAETAPQAAAPRESAAGDDAPPLALADAPAAAPAAAAGASETQASDEVYHEFLRGSRPAFTAPPDEELSAWQRFWIRNFSFLPWDLLRRATLVVGFVLLFVYGMIYFVSGAKKEIIDNIEKSLITARKDLEMYRASQATFRESADARAAREGYEINWMALAPHPPHGGSAMPAGIYAEHQNFQKLVRDARARVALLEGNLTVQQRYYRFFSRRPLEIGVVLWLLIALGPAVYNIVNRYRLSRA